MKNILTYEEIVAIIDAPKSIVENGTQVSVKSFNISFPLNVTFVCGDVFNLFKVFVKIQQSAKVALHISCHSQDDDTHTPLFRIDYWGKHSNPKVIKPSLPEIFVPYVGREFEHQSHVHYAVDGYKLLAWALPIDKTPFKELEELTPLNIQNIIVDFCQAIHIQTKINFEGEPINMF